MPAPKTPGPTRRRINWPRQARCSAAWFERTASAAMVNSIYRFKIDRVQVKDDFEPAPEW